MTADLSTLIARLEAAEGADRELDAEICVALRYIGELGNEHMWTREWKGPLKAKGGRIILCHDNGTDGPWTQAPAITTSLDAALALAERVLPGWWWAVGHYGPHGLSTANVSIDGKLSGRVAEAKTPALALCLATLRALEQQP